MSVKSSGSLRAEAVCLEPAQVEALERLSEAFDRPKSWVLRTAFVKFLETEMAQQVLQAAAS